MRLYAFPSIHIASTALFFLAGGGNLPGQTNSASILGSVLTQVNQPVAKAFVSATRTALPPLRQTVQSAADGSFSFHNLPAGNYYLCVQPVTDGFLDPCAWSAAPPTIALAAGQTSAGNTVRLMSGSVLKVHLDDPGQFMIQKTAAGFAPHLSLGVYDARTTLQPMHLSARTVASADYQVTIPLDTKLTFSIYSHNLALTDAAAVPVANGAASTVFQHTTGDPNPPSFSVLLVLGVTALCVANEPLPYFREFARLDRIFALTGTPSRTGSTALELLELVALGRTGTIQAGVEASVGLAPGELQQAAFAEPSVRVHAMQKIGECELPEALDFLQNLKRSDLGEDTTQMVWPNSRVALQAALLIRIKEPESRTEFLVNILREGDGRGLVAHWAGEQLCDQGVSSALPLIRRSIKSNWSGAYGEEQVAFCEKRMEVVARDPDRAKALGSVLAVDTGAASGSVDDLAASERLMYWAVDRLESMHSPSADAELDRFAKQLDKLRQGMPQYSRFWGIREEVRDARLRRTKQRVGER